MSTLILTLTADDLKALDASLGQGESRESVATEALRAHLAPKQKKAKKASKSKGEE